MAQAVPAAALGSSTRMALPHKLQSTVRVPLRPRNGLAIARPQRTRAMGIDIAATVSALQHQLEEELVLEGALHVSAVQAGSCMQRFGNALDSFEAPELSGSAAGPAQRSLAGEADIHVQEEAVCLAMPCDPGGEARSARQARVANPALRVSNAAGNSEEQVQLLADELLQQRAALLNLSSGMTEALEASANIRRRRRRQLIRMLRASRNHARVLLSIPASALDRSSRV